MNFQNIPRSDKVIKRAFIPKLDALLFFDYKQIEYRLLAFYLASTLGDTGMAEVFQRGDDLHAESAKAILGLTGEPTEDERAVGKTYNFLTIYGGGAYKASQSLGIPITVAQEQQRIFHQTWPGIKQLHNPPYRNGAYKSGEFPGAIQRRLADRGYIATLWGRHLRPEEPHKALNALVHGCAADLMRAALVNVHKSLTESGMKSHLVSVIHDELILDADADEIPHLQREVPVLMDYEPVSCVVPIETDMEWSTSTWADKTTYETEVLSA